MKYLGGKSKIARALAAEVNAFRRERPFWDPFCGSLAMCVALGGRGFVSDAQPALMHMYAAIANGWTPPTVLPRKEWQAARALPDTDPLKAFAGFAGSYGGKWFAGYDAEARTYTFPLGHARAGEQSTGRGAEGQRKALLRDVNKLIARGCRFGCVDFMLQTPRPGLALYLDPPYLGTTPYAGVAPFNHDLFCTRVEQWAEYGPVCVSEYKFPIGRMVWERERPCLVDGNRGTRVIERLYVVGA